MEAKLNIVDNYDKSVILDKVNGLIVLLKDDFIMNVDDKAQNVD